MLLLLHSSLLQSVAVLCLSLSFITLILFLKMADQFFGPVFLGLGFSDAFPQLDRDYAFGAKNPRKLIRYTP